MRSLQKHSTFNGEERALTEAAGLSQSVKLPNINGKADASQNVRQCLEIAAANEPALRAFCELNPDGALLESERLDAVPMEDRCPLHGLPFAAKEIFDAKGLLCQWGSPVHAGRRAEKDCKAVQLLRNAGAVLLGTTTSTEYAMAMAPDTTNPYNVTRTPGASSSGSAAAVGAGIVPFALGSQTIGSGIRPAAYCGVFGFKPTVGSISLNGVMPLAKTLDTCVLLASSIETISDVFAVLNENVDLTDPPHQKSENPDSVIAVPAWFDEPPNRDVEDGVKKAVEYFEDMGCAIEYRSISHLVLGEAECLMTILCYEMAQVHIHDRKAHGDLMSDRIRSLIDRGWRTSEVTYRLALDRREEIRTSVEEQIPKGGIMLTYSTVDVAPLRQNGTGSRAPQRLWTLLGWPAISVPVGFASGLPIAAQLIGRAGKDIALLRKAKDLVHKLQGQ